MIEEVISAGSLYLPAGAALTRDAEGNSEERTAVLQDYCCSEVVSGARAFVPSVDRHDQHLFYQHCVRDNVDALTLCIHLQCSLHSLDSCTGSKIGVRVLLVPHRMFRPGPGPPLMKTSRKSEKQTLL